MHVTSTVGEFVSQSVLTCASKHYVAIVIITLYLAYVQG